MIRDNKITYYDLRSLKNYIYGAPNIDTEGLNKISYRTMEKINPSKQLLESNVQTSGIRLRIKTNSKFIAITSELVRTRVNN